MLFKKILIIGTILLFLGTCITPSIAINNSKKSTLPISTGNTLYVGGTGPGNYTKIQDAIDNASDGDTVFVYDDSSPYYENLVIDKKVYLYGENRETTIIDGMKKGDGIKVNIKSGKRIFIAGFTIRNCYSSSGISAGIFLDNSDSHIIFYNIFLNNEYNGILIYSSNNITVWKNDFMNNDVAINLYRGNNNSISENLILDNVNALEIGMSSENNSIFSNIIRHNIRSIDVYHSGYNKFYMNIIDDSYSGLHLLYSEQEWGYTSNNYVFRNNISNIGTDYALKTDNASNNFIYHNNFVNNSYKHVYDSSNNNWDDDYPSGGNYWSDYTGNDSDGDGIGDTPYPIPGGDNEDRYPLMSPFINNPPEAPNIDGPTKCKKNVDYHYTFFANDSEGDDIFYFISWGDSCILYQYGPFPSGEKLTLSYNWSIRGTFNLTCWASDIYGAESDWATLEITVPRTRASSFHWFLERFPLLERLLGLF